MDLSIYVGKRIYVNLLIPDNYYFTGKCISADSDSLTLIDKQGKVVTLHSKNIASVREVDA